MLHGAVLFQHRLNLGYLGRLLAHGYINTINRFPFVVKFLLVQNSIDGHRGLTRLSIPDNQLPLSPSDGDHGIYGFDTGLKRFVYRLSVYYARSFSFKGHLIKISFKRTFPVYGIPQCIHYPPEHAFSYIDGSNSFGPFYSVTLPNGFGITEKHGAYVIFFKIKHHCFHTAFKLNQLTGLRFGKSVYPGDTVTYL
jgi:hypothetical protein